MTGDGPTGPIEVWGGLECTVNRIGDHYLDQSRHNGHDERPDDLDLFAGLGIRAIRYPVLWERTAPGCIEDADWSRADQRLGRLRDLGVRPIVGLVHHGSGPRDTNLLDPAFPARLAAFAGAVARRYPWVEDWTPVNEPLTTARFSALYGHWYPHHRDDRSFARALVVQCRAVVLAMRAIRAVNPGARLVQTDDLGKTFATPALAYQAEMENERRWISWDLIAGRLTPERVMWRWLRQAGVPEGELAWFVEHPCPPSIVGVNTYLSSERFLDERVDRYPDETPGGNERHAYVDVLAARVLHGGAPGPDALLREAWERYRLPVAVTEAHNGCTREEQIRWLDEVWRGAERARAAGADVRAVTVWSLLGAFDWRSLVTRDEGDYEPGVFDLRSPTPRPTAIARMVRDLATKGRHDHPVLAVPGWWRRPDRFIYGHAVGGEITGEPEARDVRPVLIVGERTLAVRALVRACRERSIPYRLAGPPGERPPGAIAPVCPIEEVDAWAVLDACAHTSTGSGGCGPAGCSECRGAVERSAAVAAACARLDRPLLAVSTDRVFDGSSRRPYVEGSPVSTRGARNRWHVDRERSILDACPSALVVRTGPLFGGDGASDSVGLALRSLALREAHVADTDEVCSPTYAPDVANAALDLLLDGERGIWHLAHHGAASWFDPGRAAVEPAGTDSRRLVHGLRDATRPPRFGRPVLASERGHLLPGLEDALARHVRSLAPLQSVDLKAAATHLVGRHGEVLGRAPGAESVPATDAVVQSAVSAGQTRSRRIPVRWTPERQAS